MSNLICRLLPDRIAAGAWNMAADEAMLHSAASGLASLRFYGWDTATVSLGYFQSVNFVHANTDLARLPLVRRATGGETLVHHHEVTYALALPADSKWLKPAGLAESWTGRMHRLIAMALGKLGVLLKPCQPGDVEKRGEMLCFLHHTVHDLLLEGHKVVGSAQRKVRGALLQHGGILLKQSPHTPELPGIAELSDITLWPSQVASAVQAEIKDQLGWHLEPGDWTTDETMRITNLIATRYAHPAWTNKR